MGRIAIYPGTFDPVTYGHLDVIERATKIFDEVIVAVTRTSRKKLLFDIDERVGMIKETTAKMKNVRVGEFDGLIIDYAKKNNVNVLIRGLRMISDFEYELQMALTNRRLDGEIETLFLMPSEGYSFLSSALIKEVAHLGANISSFVPEIVEKKVKKRLGV
ncbi:MAG: pantetheine-phosphate adenylyltransferase [Candidatus Zapsychrus exili]|nr:pantetheine-phosphate adenylyltransferase [Candidatus Zapsychrus exili]